MFLRPEKNKLATMFSIMFATAFIVISAIFYVYDYQTQKATLKQNLKSQADSVLAFAGALLESRNEKFFSGESYEVPQIIHREVFDKFTAVSGGKVFYKEASNTPVNPNNMTTDYEKEAIDTFVNDRSLETLEMVVEDGGKEYYMMAKPMVSEQRCIQCHPQWTPGNVIAIEDVRIDMVDFNAALSESLVMTSVTALLNILVILFLTHYLFSKHVAARINKVLELIFRVEKGHFVIDDLIKDEPIEQGSTNNEIDRLFRHLNKMVDTLRPVIGNVVDSSKLMAFEASYGYVRIDQTHSLVEEQNRALEISQEHIDKVLNINGTAGENLQKLLENSQHSEQMIASGQKEITGNLKDSENASSAMDETVLAISELRDFSNEISSTIEVITDIADETNLIALNAAIEAARAGEHGRGFAVVAEKIRELAEISLSNAQTINNVLKNIHGHIDKVTNNAEHSKEVIRSLGESSIKLNERFEEIKGGIDLMKNVLGEFRNEFSEETIALTHTSEELTHVKDSSRTLVDNANSSKEVMNILVQKGGELKSLADGFEVVLNKRNAKRTIITPPIEGVLHVNGKKYDSIFLFDCSTTGISFYDISSDMETLCRTGDRGRLELSQPTDGHDSFNFEVVYISEESMKGVFFYGAKIK
ncbi:MAG: methyl-accepting chemotaxis protein [Campylobacterota bacterium]|nr:methyl-accepting chemotaxis protein [Campylobacterota bacterium]